MAGKIGTLGRLIERFIRFAFDYWLLLATIADTASDSFTHLLALAQQNGQHGWAAISGALIFDLVAVAAAREMQRDKRHNRVHRGWYSAPTVVFFIALGYTVAGNVANSYPTAWGFQFDAAPPVALMVLVGFVERRTNGDRRRSRTQPGTGTRTQPGTGTAAAPVPVTGRGRPAPVSTGKAQPAAAGWVIPPGHRITGIHSADAELSYARDAVAALEALNPGRKVSGDALRKACGKSKAWALAQLKLIDDDGLREAAG